MNKPISINLMEDTFLRAKDGTDPFSEVSDFLLSADLNILNLETCITTSSDPIKKMIPSKTDPLYTKYLKSKIDCVCLSNNHIFDYKERGVKDTINFLSDNNIGFTGINNHDLKNGIIRKINDKRIGILSFYGINNKCSDFTIPDLELKNIKDDITEFKQKVDFLIVYFHWGYEFNHCVSDKSIEIAHKTIDFGADIIFGSHSHWIQPIENYKNSIIFYGLGNFNIPNYLIDKKFNTGMIVSLKIDRSKICYNAFEVKIDTNYKPNITRKIEQQDAKVFADKYLKLPSYKKKIIMKGLNFKFNFILFLRMIKHHNCTFRSFICWLFTKESLKASICFLLTMGKA